MWGDRYVVSLLGSSSSVSPKIGDGWWTGRGSSLTGIELGDADFLLDCAADGV